MSSIIWHTDPKTGRQGLYWVDKPSTPPKQGMLISLDYEHVLGLMGDSLPASAITRVQNGMYQKGFVEIKDYGKLGITEALVPLLIAGGLGKKEAKILADRFVRFVRTQYAKG